MHVKRDDNSIGLPLEYGAVTKGNLISNGYANSLIAQIKFVNFTTETLIIHFRDSSFAVLTPELENNKIKINALCIGHSKRNVRDGLSTFPGDECEVNNCIREQLQFNANKSFYWEELITLETLKKYRVGVYLPIADVVVSLGNNLESMAYHPFSRQYIHTMYLNLLENFNSSHDFSFSLRFVDNEGLVNRLYAVFNNKVIVLTGRKSNVMKTGIYISGLTSIINEYCNEVRTDSYHTLTEALSEQAPIRVFRTIGEARKSIESDKELKIENEKLIREHEIYINNVRLEKEKLEHESLLLKSSIAKDSLVRNEIETLRDVQAARDKTQIERTILQDKVVYNETMNNQKLAVEAFKTISSIAVIGFGIYKLFAK